LSISPTAQTEFFSLEEKKSKGKPVATTTMSFDSYTPKREEIL